MSHYAISVILRGPHITILANFYSCSDVKKEWIQQPWLKAYDILTSHKFQITTFQIHTTSPIPFHASKYPIHIYTYINKHNRPTHKIYYPTLIILSSPKMSKVGHKNITLKLTHCSSFTLTSMQFLYI